MSKTKNLGAYFRARTRKLKSGCWEWQGSTERRGYGRMGLGGKMCMAHRVAYEHFVGPIPPGAVVCHRCDNPSCCNPEHLFLGTQKDNVADMVRKG